MSARLPTSPLTRALAIAAAIFVALTLGLIGLRAAGADVVAMLRDPGASQPNGSPLRGALSDFGVLVMMATGVLALLAASAVVGTERRVMLSAGIFAGVFALDDALMAHERLGHALAWLPALVYGPLIGWLGWSLVQWRGRDGAWPLAVVCGLLALSLAIDITFDLAPLQPMLSWLPFTVRAVAEDVAKLDGILCFAAIFVPLSVTAILRPSIAPHAAGH